MNFIRSHVNMYGLIGYKSIRFAYNIGRMSGPAL